MLPHNIVFLIYERFYRNDAILWKPSIRAVFYEILCSTGENVNRWIRKISKRIVYQNEYKFTRNNNMLSNKINAMYLPQ